MSILLLHIFRTPFRKNTPGGEGCFRCLTWSLTHFWTKSSKFTNKFFGPCYLVYLFIRKLCGYVAKKIKEDIVQRQPPVSFKGVLKNFRKFTWKKLCRGHFYNKYVSLRLQRLRQKSFPLNVRLLKKTYFRLMSDYFLKRNGTLPFQYRPMYLILVT